MKVLINKNWRYVTINCDGNILKINDIMHPLYDDYFLEKVSEFDTNTETVELKDTVYEYWLFFGTKGDYLYLDYAENSIKIWGTDGDDKENSLTCYAEYKNSEWNILV